MTKGQKAYEKFNKAMGVPVIFPYERLRPSIKEAWEKTAEYMYNMGENIRKETEQNRSNR